jgi:PAS domain S-box-containing protein
MVPAPPSFLALLPEPFTAEALFDAVPDVVYFVKDRAARYVVVNRALVQRLGASDKQAILGRTADEVFPAPYGKRYREQDERCLARGEPVVDELELHVYPSREPGWCVTHKVPLRDARGRIVGLAGISRDLRAEGGESDDLVRIARVVAHVRARLAEPLRVAALARLAGWSPYQLDQRFRRWFGLSVADHVQKTRIDTAMRLLEESDRGVYEIALEVGYGDASAFTRQFRRTVGSSPLAFRRAVRGRTKS